MNYKGKEIDDTPRLVNDRSVEKVLLEKNTDILELDLDEIIELEKAVQDSISVLPRIRIEVSDGYTDYKDDYIEPKSIVKLVGDRYETADELDNRIQKAKKRVDEELIREQEYNKNLEDFNKQFEEGMVKRLRELGYKVEKEK